MAVRSFLKVPDIPGPSKVVGHKGEIEVLGWSFGITQTGSFATGGGGAGKPSFGDLVVSCGIDKSSPLLLVACASGRHLKSAVLTCSRSGPKPHEFFRLELEDVIITSYQSAGADDQVPLDQISLAYGKIQATYTEAGKSGKPKPPVTGGWDVKKNSKA
jgi:type VI secretion system secreted protein Hcp